MNCLDCATRNEIKSAVGVCTTCGAGVCSSHLELDTHTITPHHGVGASRHYQTRAVTCAECAPVMTALHHQRYRDAPGAPATAAPGR